MIVYRPTYQDKKTGETRQTEHYYFRHRGKRYPTHIADKRAAEAKARDMINQLELGYDPRQLEKTKREDLLSLVEQFIDNLVSKTGLGHRNALDKRLRKLIGDIGATTLPEFTADKVERWLRDSGLSARTRHHFTRHCKQFGTYLVKIGKVACSPFATLPAITNIDADRRRNRRALTDTELATLLEAVQRSRYTRCGVTPKGRQVLYHLAVVSGCRRDELASLTPASFMLAEEQGAVSYVVVRASCTKNKKEARQPLPSFIVPILREFFAGKPKDKILFPISKKKTGLMIARDMREAGLEPDLGAQIVDFHSLRVTYGTSLAIKGVPLALAQKLLRHSTPVLTANIYTVAQLSDLGREVEKLG